MTRATQPVSDSLHCPHCGRAHPAGATFCPNTGRALQAARASQWVWPALGGLGLFLLAIGAGLLLGEGWRGKMASAVAGPSAESELTLVATAASPAPAALLAPSPSATATLTPLPSATPTATDTPLPTATPCTYLGRFVEVWNLVREALGCPQGNEVSGGAGAAQVTTSGRVYWVAATRRIYAFGSNGAWLSVPDLWVEGNPTYSCDAGRRAGFIRGFGRAWCDHTAIQALLGVARGNEYAVSVSLMTFDNGFILRSEGVTRVAYNTGVWESR